MPRRASRRKGVAGVCEPPARMRREALDHQKTQGGIGGPWSIWLNRRIARCRVALLVSPASSTPPISATGRVGVTEPPILDRKPATCAVSEVSAASGSGAKRRLWLRNIAPACGGIGRCGGGWRNKRCKRKCSSAPIEPDGGMKRRRTRLAKRVPQPGRPQWGHQAGWRKLAKQAV